MIELRFTPTAADYGRAHLYLQRRLIGRRYWIYIAGLALTMGAAGFGFMMLYMLAYDAYAATDPQIVLGAIGIFFLGAYATLILRFLLRRSLNRALYRPGGFWAAEQVMRLDENGFTTASPMVEFRAKWSEVSRLARTKHYLFLLFATTIVYIPCRIAASEAELEKLWSQLQLWHTAANNS